MFLCEFCLRIVALVGVQLTELNDEGEGEPPLPSPLSCVLSFPIGCSTFE
jgi:hypothetical protein